MRRFLLGIIVGIVIMIPVTALGQTAYQKIDAYINPDIKVAVDGEYIDLEHPPIVYEQRTYLPVRLLVENVMGNEVNWVQETTTVEIKKPEIWPVNDVSKGGEIVGEGIDFSELGYDEFYDIDESLEYYEVARLIERLKGRIDQHESVVDAAKNPKSGFYTKPDLVSSYQTELDKMNTVLPLWEELLDKKVKEAGLYNEIAETPSPEQSQE